MNDILQYGAVFVALIICVIWIVRKIRRSPDKTGSCCDCSGCPLSQKCESKKTGGDHKNGKK